MARHPHMTSASLVRNSTRIIVLLFVLFTIIVHTPSAFAQTCSCGGPPLLGSLESLPGSAGNLQLGITYDFRSISDLVSFTTKLDDETRSRDSRAILLQAEYSLTDRFTLALSSPFVRQNRTILSEIGNGENLRTKGFGDIMALAKYSLIPQSIFSKQSVAVGLGIKLPTGESELRNNSLLLSADMQTGTGSVDYILWAATSRIISRNSSLNIFASSLYRINGNNDRFGSENENYKFGNEFRLVTGTSFQLVSNFIQSISLKYRHSQADKFADLPLASSGGQWFDLESGVSTNVLQNIGLNMTALIPVYRQIEGTQFSTSYAVSFSLFYNLNLKGSVHEQL